LRHDGKLPWLESKLMIMFKILQEAGVHRDTAIKAVNDITVVAGAIVLQRTTGHRAVVNRVEK